VTKNWGPITVGTVLEWFAVQMQSAVFRDVPVSRPSWRGWPADAKVHRFDAIAIAAEEPCVEAWDEGEFEALVGADVVRPIVARGYADRPVFGQLAVGSALLARSYPSHGLLRPTALVAPGQATPNTAPAYWARGYEIVAVPRELLP
jgi:hypothetical protein